MNLEKLKQLSMENEKSLEQIALKLSEETGEVAQALLCYVQASGSTYKRLSKKDVQEECIDTLIVALSLFYKLEGTDAELDEVLKYKLDKWEKKVNGEGDVLDFE